MNNFKSEMIRNVALIGHGGSGKTSLAEAMLYNCNEIDRIGNVLDGNTVMDFDELEMQRKSSISLSSAFAVWKNVKINIVDTPGFFDFEGEVKQALFACDCAVLVVDCNKQISVGAEKMIELCLQDKKPLIIFINGIDKENADVFKTVEVYRTEYGKKLAPMQVPIMEGNKMQGYISLIGGKAFMFSQTGREQIDLPAHLQADFDRLRQEVMESSAENDDELFEKYLNDGVLTNDEIIVGLKKGVVSGSTIPMIAGSSYNNKGVINLLNEIIELMPSPKDREDVFATDKDGEVVSLLCDREKPFVAQVFKTIVDPFVGKLNMIRVHTGVVNASSTVFNLSAGEKEKINQIYLLKGKKQKGVESLSAGDIGAVNKLVHTCTGDTLTSDNCDLMLPQFEYSNPILKMAIKVNETGDEDKIFQGLKKLEEEDLTFKVEKDSQTKEMVIIGQGETQLEIIVRKLKAKFGVTVNLETPKIAFKETIRGTSSQEGKHKKQSGGAGQYGVVNIKFERGAKDGVFEFVDAVVGGAVPRQFIPAVEKGLREAMQKGVLAGYHMVDLKCTLFDGKFHPVDSKEVAFISASKQAYEEGCKNAKPCLLEPICTVKITVPEVYMGDIMGDMNKRRGKIIGMEAKGNKQEIVCEVPTMEMQKYSIDLRSMTQGRGRYTMEFLRYSEVPDSMVEKVIESSSK